MAQDINSGDRVMISNGECGTVIRIDGGLAYIQLESSLRVTAWIGSLQKPVSDEKASDTA